MYALRQARLSRPTAHTHRPCNLQPQYLSGYSVKECSSICDGVTEPFCAHCPAQGASPNCNECHECLSQHHIGRYNIMDGTCLRLVEYGILYGQHAPQSCYCTSSSQQHHPAALDLVLLLSMSLSTLVPAVLPMHTTEGTVPHPSKHIP